MMFVRSKYLIIASLLLIAVGLLFIFKKNNPEIALTPQGISSILPGGNATTSEEIKNESKGTPEDDVAAIDNISTDNLLSCLGKGGESGNCLDLLFRGFLKKHTPVQALALVTNLGQKNSNILLSCHPIVHAVGRETFRETGTVHDSFSACDQTCHSGCYHGAMERFLRGALASNEGDHVSAEEVKNAAKTACDPNQALRFRFQCLHGLGHALMYFLDYDLEGSLSSCDAYPDGWSRSSCYGGVFMENVFTATPEKRDLSPTDYHYPCSKLDPMYRSDCYMMQTTRMTEMGLDTNRLFEECKKAGAPDQEGQYRLLCMQSIGRDLSNDARIGDPRTVSEKCERVSGDNRQACTRGVVYALEDNTWTGQYSFPFCNSFMSEADQRYCFSIGISYLKMTFEATDSQIKNQCTQYAPTNNICKEN